MSAHQFLYLFPQKSQFSGIFREQKLAYNAGGEGPRRPEAEAPAPERAEEREAVKEGGRETRKGEAETAAKELSKLSAYDMVVSKFGDAFKGKKANRAKRRDIWREMGKSEPFRYTKKQNEEIRKHLLETQPVAPATKPPTAERHAEAPVTDEKLLGIINGIKITVPTGPETTLEIPLDTGTEWAHHENDSNFEIHTTTAGDIILIDRKKKTTFYFNNKGENPGWTLADGTKREPTTAQNAAMIQAQEIAQVHKKTPAVAPAVPEAPAPSAPSEPVSAAPVRPPVEPTPAPKRRRPVRAGERHEETTVAPPEPAPAPAPRIRKEAAPVQPSTVPKLAKPVEQMEIGQNEQLIAGKTYGLKETTDLFAADGSHQRILRKKTPVRLIGTETRKIDNTEYVQVEAANLKGWIKLENLSIPDTDTLFLSPDEQPAQPLPAAERDQMDILGTYTLTKKIRGSELLQELFTQFKDDKLEEELNRSEISHQEYLSTLQAGREGSVLNIFAPKQKLEAAIAEHEKAAVNTDYQATIERTRSRVYGDREHYLTGKFRLTDEKLKNYIQNTEKWNDLFAIRGAQSNESLAGIETINAAYQKFSITGIQVRDELRKVLQIWTNDTITFEDVFDRYVKEKLYKEGDYNAFKEEFEGLVTDLAPWTSTEGQEKLKALGEYNVTVAELTEVQKHNPDNWKSTPEYATWKRLGEQKTHGQTIDEIISEYNRNRIMTKIKRIEELRKNVLEPIADFLDAIEGLKVGTTKNEGFYEKHQAMISGLPSIEEPNPEKPAIQMMGDFAVNMPQTIHLANYYDIQLLTDRKGGSPAQALRENQESMAITVQKEASDQFKKVAKEFGIAENTFTTGEQLRIIFQLYSIDTLVKEGCVSRIKDSNYKLILTKLPENFEAANPKIKELFEAVKTADDIDGKKALIEKISRSLDQNEAALARINEVFGEDRGQVTHFNWQEKLSGFFTGADTREINLTMSDIAAGKVTMPTADFLKKHMAGNAAASRLMKKITRQENGIETYSHDLLKSELKRKLKIGLDTLFLSDDFKTLREEVLGPFGTIEQPSRIDEAYKSYARKIDNFDEPLDEKLISVIRIGEVMGQVVEAGQEEVEYSASPEIRQIQEALVREGYSKQDIKKVEETLLGGVVLNTTGGVGIGAGAVIDLGDGWKLTPHAGIGPEGVTAGAAVSKTVELSKDGRTALTLGVQGGFLHIGGHARLQIPLSETIEGTVQGAAGITAIGFYAGGGISLRRNTSQEDLQAFREAQKDRGFTETAELIREKASPAEIREAIFKIPGYGAQFKRLKTEYHISDEAIRELFMKAQGELKDQITGAGAEKSFNIGITEVGGFTGLFNGLPFFGGYLVVKLGEELVLVRSVMPGYEKTNKVSSSAIDTAIKKRVHSNFSMLRATTGETGHLVLDASGDFAVLESGKSINMRQFATFPRFQEELKKINIDVAQSADGVTFEAQTPRRKPANIKYNIDPLLNAGAVTVKDGKVLIAGIKTADLKDFIVSREDFIYPYEKEGSHGLSIITIKKNPARTRQQIETESTHFIYKRVNSVAQIEKGAALRGTSNIIQPEIYEKAPIRVTEGIEHFDQKHFERFKERKTKALNVLKQESFEAQPRKGVIPEFADKFYAAKGNQKKFLELSTVGTATYNIPELVKIIQESAKKTDFKELNNQEINQIILYLTTKSFMNAKDKKKVFERNLEFARKDVLIPFFQQPAIQALELSSTPEVMAAKIADDLKNTDFSSEAYEHFDPGTLFLSTVGTKKVIGLRGTTYYGSEMDLAGQIINFKQYKPGTGLEGDISKAVLEILSPLETNPEKVKEFMKSPLAIKMAAHDGLYLILGAEDAMKVIECFEQQAVSSGNSKAFEKFRKIVLDIRKSQNNGRNFIELPNGYKLQINTRVGLGVYTKCTNPSMAGTETISILAPRAAGIAAGREENIRVNPELQRRDIEALIGVTGIIEREKPVAGPASSVSVDEEGEGTNAIPGDRNE